MNVTIENNRIAEAFKAVWNALPEEDRANLETRIAEVAYQDKFRAGDFAFTCGGSVTYDAKADKAQQPPYRIYLPLYFADLDINMVKHDMAHLLGHIYCKHAEEMYQSNGFLSGSEDLEEAEGMAESEADERVSIWEYPGFDFEAWHKADSEWVMKKFRGEL